MMKTDTNYLPPRIWVLQIQTEISVCTSGQPESTTIPDLNDKYDWENDLWQ